MHRPSANILVSMLGATLLLAPPAMAAPMELELVRPDGVVTIDPIDVLPHPDSLNGKTVALKWSGKPNGDIMLTRIAELIAQDFPDTKVVKTWEDQPQGSLLTGWSTNKDRSVRMAQAMRDLRPDLVVGGQGD